MIKPKPLGKLTKKHFQAYEKVRESGRYNMIAQARSAAAAADLDIETYMGIVKHYESLMKKWPDVRK